MIGRILILVLLSSAAAVPIKAQATSPDDGFSLPRLAQAPQLAQFGNRKGGNKGERKMKRRGEMGGGFGSGGGMAVAEPCDRCEGLDGFVPAEGISEEIRLMVGKMKGVDKAEAVAVQKARGGIETGLRAAFAGGAACPEIDSEQWAIDYSAKRPWPAIHKGVDIPQPRGTPIHAVAAGTVVGKFMNDGNRKGIEIMLRHAPEQTGLPFWSYSQYTHLETMSPLAIGAEVKLGDEVGRTANTGKMGRRIRRDALHFAILYSQSPDWSNDGRFVIPKDSYWMDPNAFYRQSPPYDSQSLAALPTDQKRVPVAHMTPGGAVVPETAKRIWPYPCE